MAFLDIRNSGDTAGPRDRVVGYGSWALYDPRTDAELGQILLGLARRAIERRLTDHPQPLPIPDMPALNELKTKAGLAAHHWSDRFQAARFTATEYHEA